MSYGVPPRKEPKQNTKECESLNGYNCQNISLLGPLRSLTCFCLQASSLWEQISKHWFEGWE